MYFFELAGPLVLADIVPVEIAAVHGHIDTGGKDLGEGQRATQVEKPIRAAEFVGDHGACQHNRLSRNFFGQHPCGDGHGIGAMGDDDLIFSGGPALVCDELAVVVVHMKAVDHHERPYCRIQCAAAAQQHFGKVGLFEEEFAGELIVFFVECASRDKYADSHKQV